MAQKRFLKWAFFCWLSALCGVFLPGCASSRLELRFEGERTHVFRNGKALEFREILLKEMKTHPAMEGKDILKLCFQGAYGPKHLSARKSSAGKYFAKEFAHVSPRVDEPLFEMISPDFFRVNLGAWKAAKLPPEWLFNMFASTGTLQDGDKLYREYIAVAAELLRGEKKEEFLRLANAPLTATPRHSQNYRQKERPSYRLVSSRFLPIFPVLKKAAALPEKAVKVIVIDGRSASGKTTLARQLAQILRGDVVHMDDFFLPLSLRSPERYREPGGNVHYERFMEEVLPFLHKETPFRYRKFDCSKMELGGMVELSRGKWRIVEGAYSFHPRFGKYGDLMIFYDVAPEEQMRRIRERNGAVKAEMFRKRWIPLEELYIQNCRPAEKADLVINPR